ncbi:hypothetical protein GOP47_0011390, partial [Adiantum capillus-veneris]
LGYLKLGPSARSNTQITWMRMLKSPTDPSGYLVPLIGLRVNHEDLPLSPSTFNIDPTATQ